MMKNRSVKVVLPSTTEMSFSEALERIKKGYKVSRKGWNGKGLYIELLPKQTVKTAICGDIEINEMMIIRGPKQRTCCWVPSMNDALAEDWELVK